ncbi:MAG: YebC/PmpR family DNA-binding transcriptional regulator, partial [Desulfovermiculus sp.]
VTDNKNRTVAEIRKLFSKAGGNLGESGCVGWMFQTYGVLTFDKNAYDEDQLLEVGLEAGVEDVIDDGDAWEVRTAPEDYLAVKQAFEQAGIEIQNAEVAKIPQTYVELDVETAEKALKLYEQLDEHDDVQKVHANFEIPDELYAKMEA